MITCGQILARLNSIEKKYGDVALAAAMFCLAIAVHGAFAVASLHRQADVLETGDGRDVVAQQAQRGTPALFDGLSRPIPATIERHEITVAQVANQPTTPTMNSTAETVPARSAHVSRPESAARPSVPSASVHSTVANTVTKDQVDGSADGPVISALSTNDGDGLTAFTISALSGNDRNVLPEPVSSPQPAISAVGK